MTPPTRPDGTDGTDRADGIGSADGTHRSAGTDSANRSAGTDGMHRPADAAGTDGTDRPADAAGTDGTDRPADAAGADGTDRSAGTASANRPADVAGTDGGTPERPPVTERRLHPVTPFRRAWAPLAVLAGWAAHDPGGAQEQLARLTHAMLLLGLAVLVPAAGLYGFLSWWFTHYAVTDTELRIRTGLLFRRTAHIRLERVQAVDVSRPLLARVAGVAKLRIDVVGTDDKDELAFLSEREARALRAELLARAAGFAPETAKEVGEAPAHALLRVPPRELARSLVLTGATWGSLCAALIVPTVLWLVTQNVWTVLASALPLLGTAGASSVGRFVTEFDWTVSESPDGLHIDHGLLDRTHETVPPGRVQTVRIVEPLLWRLPGWVRVELDVAGSANSVLVPVAPRAVAESVVARVLPGITAPRELSRAPRRARWCVPVRWRGHRLAVTGTVFAARSGLLCRRLSLVPHAKVQSVRLTQGPWERCWGLADVHVDTGADKTVTARLRDAEEAARLLGEQAERSRTGRRDALPDRWMTSG